MHQWKWSGGRARMLVRAGLVVGIFCVACVPARAQDGEDGPTIVVFGDSQAAGLARGLQRVLAEDRRFRVLNRTHPGAALVHDSAEWLAPIQRFGKREKADIAVVMFGANDRLDLREGRTTLRFRTEAWRAEYAARITKILDLLAATELRVLWLGNPIARSARYSKDMGYINELYAEAITSHGFEFMPLWNVVADEAGGYTAYGKDRAGVTQRLRGDDGIHFTSAGYELIAEKVLDLLSKPEPARGDSPPAGTAASLPEGVVR